MVQYSTRVTPGLLHRIPIILADTDRGHGERGRDGWDGPVGSRPPMTDFLAAAAERVLILDGAFGTWVQGQDLGPDDFGGAALEGCNEHLVVTRPDLIRRMHDEYFAVGVDAVETATFGAFALVLAEYDLAASAYEMNVTAARIAKESAEEWSTPSRPRWVVGSLGPGTRLPSLGAITFDA